MNVTKSRPSSVPLVVCDPYLSIWSHGDNLYDDFTRHWTGTEQPLSGYVRIDGETFRFMGYDLVTTPVIPQKSVEVFPTKTVYVFANEKAELTLTFLSPCLPHDLDLFSWPLSYISYSVRSLDGVSHDISLYFDAYADMAVHSWQQQVEWGRYKTGSLDILRVGSREQAVLEKSGDFQRIDWGYFYMAFPRSAGETCLTNARDGVSLFRDSGKLPLADYMNMPVQVRYHKRAWYNTPALCCVFTPPSVGAGPVSGYFMLAYDDLFSVEYMHRRLRPYWRKAGRDMGALLAEAEKRYPEIQKICGDFDAAVDAELKAAGGSDYAYLGKLAFRQAAGAQKLARDFDGTPLHFSKENTSNGCIATVDITYPTAPFALRYNPELLRAELTPVLEYAQSDHWPHPFAPHDIGTYPLANGQAYRGGVYTAEQMPVEECGNMLILVAALSKTDGSAEYARRYWSLLVKWAEYLAENGYAPDNQLCTDDFAGRLAKNSNLSVKAIVALGAFAKVCAEAGEKEAAARYGKIAKEMADNWLKDAEDGDHYVLAFGEKGTWSLKYNLVWDKLLKLNLFPPELYEKELEYYRKKMQTYGCPLDNRSDYTKLDWEVWIASLYESREDFMKFIGPIVRFVDETPDRVPMSDWYYTTTAKYQRFQSRSVVGGVFIRLLEGRL